jgi:hypothetical protein
MDSGGDVGRNDRADRQQIKPERDRLPDREREAIGHQRQRGGDEQKERRIVPAVELRRGAEDHLLAGELPRRVERRRGIAVEHISARGVDIGEIGAERPALQVDAAVRGHDQIEKADGRSHKSATPPAGCARA